MIAAPDHSYVTLESPKGHKALIEANAIVRYLAAIGSKPWGKTGEDALKDQALIEYEETILSTCASKNADRFLALAESVIVKANLTTEPPSPAELIIFSTLYHVASTAKIDPHPALSAWFSKVVRSSWAKAGIEKATVLTTVEPRKKILTTAEPRKKIRKAPAIEDTSERVLVKKIKAGVEMKIPKAGEEM